MKLANWAKQDLAEMHGHLVEFLIAINWPGLIFGLLVAAVVAGFAWIPWLMD